MILSLRQLEQKIASKILPWHKAETKSHKTVDDYINYLKRAHPSEKRQVLDELFAHEHSLFGRNLKAEEKAALEELYRNPGSDIKSAITDLKRLKANYQKTLEPTPELVTLVNRLDELRESVEKLSPDAIIEKFQNVKGFIEELQTDHKNLCYIKELTPSNLTQLNEFILLFKSYENLPSALRDHYLFHPSRIDLLNQIRTCFIIIEEQVDSQKDKGYATKAKDFIKSFIPSKEAVLEFLPMRNKDENSYEAAKRPLTAAQQALSYFYCGPGVSYEPERKREILLQLFLDCGEDAKNQLLEAVAQTKPETNLEAPLEWAKDHLLDYTSILVLNHTLGKILITSAEDKLVDYSPRKDCKTLGDYCSKILHAIKDDLPLELIKFCGYGLESFLSSSFVTSWLESQPEETKRALSPIVKETCEKLKNATSAASYKASLQEFIDFYNSQHTTIASLELPMIMQNKDQTTKEDQVIEQLDSQINRLKTQLDQAKNVAADFDEWNDLEKSESKIKGQLVEVGGNLRDRITYNIVYSFFVGKPPEEDPLFSNIKHLQQLKESSQDKKAIFVAELSKLFDNSDYSFLNRSLAKFIIPRLHSLVDTYVEKILSKVYGQLSETLQELESLDKRELFLRIENCFSKYGSLILAWANDANGGAKTVVIEELMKKSTALSYGGKSYTQKELFNEAQSKFIHSYLTIYDGKTTGFSPLLNHSINELTSFISTPLIRSSGSFSKLLNVIYRVNKAALVGIPGYLVLGTAYLITRLLEKATNVFSKMIVSRLLNYYDFASFLVKSVRSGIYENTPYVHPVTNFMADQLEALTDAITQQKEEDDDAPPPVSDMTRGLAQQVISQLLEVVYKNRFSTQETLQAGVKNPTLAHQATQKTLLKITDSVIDVLMLAYNKLLTRESLQEPMSLFLEQLNTVLVSSADHKSEEEKRLEKLQSQAAEEKLKKFTDKLLREVTHSGTQKLLDNIAHMHSDFAQKNMNWLKDTLLGKMTDGVRGEGLVSQWRDLLTEVQAPHSSKERFDLLNKLYDSTKLFLTELGNVQETLRNDGSRTSKELMVKIAPIINELNEFLNENNGLLALYNEQKRLYKTEEDYTFIRAYELSYLDIHRNLEALSTLTDFKDKDLHMGQVLKNMKFIKKITEQLQKGELSLLRDLSHYAELKATLNGYFAELSNKEQIIKNIENAYLPTLHTLTNISSQRLRDLLFSKNEYLKTNILQRTFSSYSYSLLYQDLLTQIQSVKLETTKHLLEEKLEAFHQATDELSAQKALELFTEQLEKSIHNQKELLNKSIQTVREIDEPVLNVLTPLCESFAEDMQEAKVKIEELLPIVQEPLAEITRSVEAISPIKFVHTKSAAITSLLKIPEWVAYNNIKPIASGVLDLFRQDGNFTEFVVDHLVFMPFVKE